jgi:hypothetical protein
MNDDLWFLCYRKENLRGWIDDFIQHVFLQQIQIDYKKRVSLIVGASEAFKSASTEKYNQAREDYSTYPVVNVIYFLL